MRLESTEPKKVRPHINALLKAAIESETALEINANIRGLDPRDPQMPTAVDARGLFAIDTNTH